MTIILRMDQKVPVKVKFIDEDDNPIIVESMPEWTTSDDTMVMIEVAKDNHSVWLFPVGPMGQARLAVRVDSFVGWFDMEVIEAIVWETPPIFETTLGNGPLRAIFRIGPAHLNHDCG